ncbi:hypothetical protein MKS27_11700, partial [Staphylococcus haemolyticus]|uniref:hypothetical protein n=1 Tax=Staphylococcus haemolyticus TaxID=1283 RepID=UPI001F0A75FC
CAFFLFKNIKIGLMNFVISPIYYRTLINQKVFDAFYKSLKGKQILVYSGLFKEARKKLKNGDLDYLKEVDPTEYIYQIFYHWNQKEYLASEIFDLTEEEKRKINHQMIDEIDEEI